jgi:hypothetical protein
MACPNFKNGPKIGLRSLGVNYTAIHMTYTYGKGYSFKQVKVSYMQVHIQYHQIRNQEMKQ